VKKEKPFDRNHEDGFVEMN